MTTTPFPPRGLLRLVTAFCVWLVALTVLYAVNAIGCTFAWPSDVQRMSLALLTLISLALLYWIWRRDTRSELQPKLSLTDTFMFNVIAWTSAAALVALIATLVPPLTLSL
ncbi:MAG: hypothetical protein KDE31_06295, partial [Caldilineaceae bacterium]|nr:hypothetical protein [Caldilineaceae bacterium]